MKKTLLLLANGFEAYEASVFIDVLGWNQLEGDHSTPLTTCGMHKQLKCTWGLTVIPELHIHDIKTDDFAALAIPGGFEEANFYQDAYHEDFLSLIRQFHAAGKHIATICVAALPLGKSGILKGRKATTYHLGNGLRQQQLAAYGATVLNQPIVIDNNIITSSCPSTALEVAFTLLEKLTNTQNSNHVKHLMGFQEDLTIDKRR